TLLSLWRQPDAQRPTSATEIDSSECSRSQNRFQRSEGRRPRAPALITHLNSMSAGGLCNRRNAKPVCGQGAASLCCLGAGAANRLDIALNGDIEADCRFAGRPILGQKAI